MAYVYRHIRLDTHQPFYIGVGNDGKNHYRAYSRNKRNTHWLRIVALTAFEVEIIVDHVAWPEALKKECEFIALYGRADIGKGTLVNMTDGGQGCVNGISPETRKKMAAALRGRKLPDWQKKILSKAAKGKKPTHRKSIVQYNLLGQRINEFLSIAEASRKLKLHKGNIDKVLSGRRNHTGNFIFKYAICE